MAFIDFNPGNLRKQNLDTCLNIILFNSGSECFKEHEMFCVFCFVYMFRFSCNDFVSIFICIFCLCVKMESDHSRSITYLWKEASIKLHEDITSK